MSAPNTDVKKQGKKHKSPIFGMIGVVIFALVLLIALTVFVTFRANEPGDGEPIEADRAGVAGEVAPDSVE